MHTYIYEGPVMRFENCIANKWRGETIATSEIKARSNLIYQFKKQNKLEPNSKITLPKKIVMIN